MTTQTTSTKVLHIATLSSLLVAAFSASALGADFSGKLKGVTITDAQEINTPPVATFTYSVNGNTVSFNAGGSSDSDGTITDYRWDFGDGSFGAGVQVQHTYNATTDIPVTLTLLDNSDGVALAQQTIYFQKPINIAVNFQPADAPIPSGFLVDDGSPYSDQKGFGWVSLPNSTGTRDRNNSISPDQAYDTFIHLSPTAKWEYKLDNGFYNVTIVMGDPTYPDTIQAAQVENNILIPKTNLSQDILWIEKQSVVNVADGALTITFNGSSTGKLCWIKISNN